MNSERIQPEEKKAFPKAADVVNRFDELGKLISIDSPAYIDKVTPVIVSREFDWEAIDGRISTDYLTFDWHPVGVYDRDAKFLKLGSLFHYSETFDRPDDEDYYYTFAYEFGISLDGKEGHSCPLIKRLSHKRLAGSDEEILLEEKILEQDEELEVVDNLLTTVEKIRSSEENLRKLESPTQ